MPVNNFDAWVPEEWGGEVVTTATVGSVVMRVGRREPMNFGDTKHVPRTGEVDVTNTGKGDAYVQDTAINDEVVLTARKITGRVDIAEEDLRDAQGFVNIAQAKKIGWANSFAKYYDNATLGVTGAQSNTASDNRPYTSIYKLVTTTDNTLEPDYTANDNRTQTGTGGTTYTTLRAAAKKYEVGAYYDVDNTVVIAAPAYKDKLRGILDSQNRPIFTEQILTDQNGQVSQTLFGYPVWWSQGARTTAAATKAPVGNPLLIFANRQHLINGPKWEGSNPTPVDSVLIPSAISTSDTTILKMRYRGGFAGGHPSAFSVHEDNSGS